MPSEIRFKKVRCKPIKNKKPEWDKTMLFVLLGIFLVLLLIFSLSKAGIGNSGHIISEEQEENKSATIRTVIEINKAEHLDENKNFLSDITDEVKEFDDIWSKEISNGEYVRITFEKPLTSKNDIKIYPRIVSGNPRIEVYETNGNEILAEFEDLKDNQYNRVFLTNLTGKQDSFDLKIVGGSVEIEHIIDPLQLNMKKEVKK